MRNPLLFKLRIGALALILSSMHLASSAAAESVGVIETISGATTVKVKSSAGVERVLGVRGILQKGDVITTEESQVISIKLSDDTLMSIGPLSQVVIAKSDLGNEQSDTDIELQKGMTHVAVQKVYNESHKFFLRTSTATMGVRGTEFFVEHGADNQTSIHTLEGSVAVGKAGENLANSKNAVLVNRGNMSSLKPQSAQPSVPKQFNENEFFRNLNTRSPAMVAQIKAHHAALKAYRSKTTPRRRNAERTWHPRKKRRAIGH